MKTPKIAKSLLVSIAAEKHVKVFNSQLSKSRLNKLKKDKLFELIAEITVYSNLESTMLYNAPDCTIPQPKAVMDEYRANIEDVDVQRQIVIDIYFGKQ